MPDTSEFSTLHHLILAELFNAHPEPLTITEVFRGMAGKVEAMGLADFANAEFELEMAGLVESVATNEFQEGRPGKTSRVLKSALTEDGRMYLLSVVLAGLYADENLHLALSGIADVNRSESAHDKSDPLYRLSRLEHPVSAEGNHGNGGDAAPYQTSPLSIFALGDPASARNNTVRGEGGAVVCSPFPYAPLKPLSRLNDQPAKAVPYEGRNSKRPEHTHNNGSQSNHTNSLRGSGEGVEPSLLSDFSYFPVAQLVEEVLAPHFCPLALDCPNYGKVMRIFECPHCDFLGCCACYDHHQAEGHWSDSDTARERYIGGLA